jgi:predicted NAD-dependent protein-ADP-ribosyltransferase YbiA (DUF1768 family)
VGSLQAQKFRGVEDDLAQACVHNIRKAKGPEEAARLGRTLARQRPDLVRPRTRCFIFIYRSNFGRQKAWLGSIKLR